MARVLVFIGLGANVGDARRTLTEAVAALGALPNARLRGVSRLYRTAPVGVTDQPDFLNAVVALDVEQTADPSADATALLVALKDLELGFGRRERERWGPREVDLDILLFGWHRVSVERPPGGAPRSAETDPRAAARLLEIPHPSMHERLFVLAPLADLAPDLVPPGWEGSVESARRRRATVEGPASATPIAVWSDADRAWIGPTGTPIRVDRATLQDAVEIATVHTASANAAYRGYVPPEPDPVGRRTGMWREILSDPDHGGFVARDGERIVGLLSVGRFRETPGLGAVHALYVLEPWWGSGAGQALMDRAHRELAGSFDAAQLTVLTANARARRFYERNGWIEAETLVEPHFGGTPTRVTRYRRSLRGRAASSV